MRAVLSRSCFRNCEQHPEDTKRHICIRVKKGNPKLLIWPTFVHILTIKNYLLKIVHVDKTNFKKSKSSKGQHPMQLDIYSLSGVFLRTMEIHTIQIHSMEEQ